MALMTPLRQVRDDLALEALAADLAALRAETAKALDSLIDVEVMKRNDHQTDTHQSNSNTQHQSDIEPASKEEGSDVPTSTGNGERAADDTETKSYPLGLVMEACPDVRDYAPGGKVRTWSDFLAAAGAVRPMIGISLDAWREALDVLGQPEAHIAVASILQRSIHSSEAETAQGPTPGSTVVTVNGSPAIGSAGGYLRALTEKARAGEFALGPVLMALIGQRLKARRRRGGG
jgi:replication initiation protein RepC